MTNMIDSSNLPYEVQEVIETLLDTQSIYQTVKRYVYIFLKGHKGLNGVNVKIIDKTGVRKLNENVYGSKNHPILFYLDIQTAVLI